MGSEDTWLNYGLPDEKTTVNRGYSYLYVLLNLKSKRIYIGQSSSYPFEERIHIHRQAIRKTTVLKSYGIIISETALTKMAKDSR